MSNSPKGESPKLGGGIANYYLSNINNIFKNMVVQSIKCKKLSYFLNGCNLRYVAVRHNHSSAPYLFTYFSNKTLIGKWSLTPPM